jgi:hypothetical protein
MIEPPRLLDEGATESERALLRSARIDTPPRGSVDRMFAALTLGGSGQPAPGPGQGPDAGWTGHATPLAAPALKGGLLTKLGIAAIAGMGALGVGGLIHLALEKPTIPVEPRTTPELVAEQPVVPPARPLAAEDVTVPSSSEEALSPRPKARPRTAAAADDSLSAEIRALDAVRAALDGRTIAAAEQALEAYAQRFPRGRLKPEAEVLRLTVLVRKGDRAAARRLSQQLLASDAYKAYAHRIRSLIREVGE